MSPKKRRKSPEDERRFPMEPPLVVKGWAIYVWPGFAERWGALREAVEELRRRDPEGYRANPTAKFLQGLRKLVLEEIPSDPASERYRQGLTLGRSHRHWRRAKLYQRFRLFFRYHSERRVILYVWLNDEQTLRKEGGRTDVYQVFRGMLERGTPPDEWEKLMAECRTWTTTDVAGA